MLMIQVTGDGLRRFQQLSQQLGDGTARKVYSRAINDTGNKAATATGRALADQAGLRRRVGAAALKDRDRSTPASLSYVIKVQGGDIRLKFFSPRETRRGVSAAPRGQRQVFAGTFQRAGWWPNRVDKPGWNRQVFERTGARKFTDKYPEGNTKFPKGMDQFRLKRSGVFLPVEATTGNTAATFDKGKNALDVRVSHYLKRLAGGAFK